MEKIWFITGSSRGLGRSLTEAVLKNGAKVAATARNPQQLDDLKAKYGGQILPLQLDVTDPKQIKAAAPRHPRHQCGTRWLPHRLWQRIHDLRPRGGRL